MKLLSGIGGLVSLLFTAVGLSWLLHAAPLGSDPSVGIFGLVSGPVLGFGLYLFHLRGRISALEKRLAERES